MAVTVECPRCTHTQKIDEDRAAKETPCKICHFMIQPAGAKAKPTGKTKLTGASSPKTKLSKDGIQAGKPAATKSAADKNTKAAPPKVNEKKKKASAENDDDDDDDRPKRKRKPDRKSAEGGSYMPLYIIGGGVAFVLMLVACGGVGAIVLASRSPKVEAQVAQNENVPAVPDIDPNPVVVIGQNPIIINPPNPIIEPQPFPQPFQPPIPVKPPIRLDPKNPDDADRVLEFLREPGQKRGQAFSWLNSADPDHPKKLEISKQMEVMFNEYYDAPLGNDGFFNPYFRWITAQNVPSLIRLAENTKFTVWDNRYRQDAIRHLGKLKDPRGVSAVAKRLGNGWDRGVAIQALEEFGPVAQAEVLKEMNNPDGGAREAARQLLAKYKTPEAAKLTQTLADLSDKDNRRRDSALNFLAGAPVDPERRPEVAKALNTALANSNGPFISGEIFRSLEKWHTVENIPELIKIVEMNRPNSRDAIILLGKMRTPESLKAVAQQVGKSFDAANILRTAGPAAEPAVILAVSTTQDMRVRHECTRLLGDVGTRNGGSLIALQQLVLRFPQDNLLRLHATSSSKRILSRP